VGAVVPFNLDSLIKAVDVLKRSVISAEQNMEDLNSDLQETIKAGVIQNFEVAYEQCWKFMQRWVRENYAPEEANLPRTRKELIRVAARSGLISDPVPWFEFGAARNLTVHTYDLEQAAEAYHTAKRFLPYAEDFVRRLQERND
jgi:nucleotidyltransferase substrate binding protein (TIGR01987 family)